MKGKVIVFVLLVCVVTIARTEPTVWYVHPDSVQNCIQDCLDACTDNDIVLVGPGTYYENIIWPNTQGIHLISELGAEVTIIDGDDAGRVIRCSTGVDTTTIIRGFTIQNGYANMGAGIRCVNNSSPTIANNIITGNTGAGFSWGVGGGIFCYNSSPTITGNTIIGNYADARGYNMAAGGGIYCDASSSIIINNRIIDNTAHNGPGWWERGGGLYCAGSSLTLKHNIIMNNAVGSGPDDRGGGICFEGCTATIDSCTIANNDPGGVHCDYNSELEIHYCDIFDNAGYGVCNADAGVMVNADSNWWGDESGPYHPDSNPGGQGDTVSDYVDFTPWLTEPVGVKEKEVIKVDRRESRATIFAGPLILPEGKKCRVFDITGRVVAPSTMRPGIYFIEVDGKIAQKVVKVR